VGGRGERTQTNVCTYEQIKNNNKIKSTQINVHGIKKKNDQNGR
jgi:hypothetical protein